MSGAICGYKNHNRSQWPGLIDDIGIWNRALTSSEVTTLFLSSASGINEVDNKIELTVSPNPTSNLLNVKASSDLKGSTYIVTDQSGKEIMNGKLSSENSTIELINCSTGIYYYTLKSGDSSISKKMIIAK